MSSAQQRGLPTQAKVALAIAQTGRQIERIQRLWTAGEHSFALLVVWMRIEALLKLLRYHDKIDDGWPKDLHFAKVTWPRLKQIEQDDEGMYEQVFRGENSLRQVRNRIVHGGLLVAPEVGAPLGYAGEWVAAQLSVEAPRREHLLCRLNKSA